MRFRAIVPIIMLFVVWEGVSRSGVIDKVLFPPPSKVALAMVEMVTSGELWRDIKASSMRLAAGIAIGVAVGVLVGLATGRISAISELVSPVITLFRPLPPVAIIPLIIVWLGIGEVAKIFSIAFAVFFPVWLNTHAGASHVAQKYLWSAATLTSSRRRIFAEVIFPSSLPFVAAGVRLGISVAFVMVFVAELAGASSGVGYTIATSHLSYRIDKMIAGLIVLGSGGALADFVFVLGLYHACPWLKLPVRA